MSVSVENVTEALRSVVDPNTGKDLVAGKSVRNVKVDGASVSLDVELGYPARSQIDPIRKQVVAAVRALAGVVNVSANVYQKIVAHAVQRGVKLLPGVKNIIAAGSARARPRSTLHWHSHPKVPASAFSTPTSTGRRNP